jgi:HAD superfamily hydrolase (TIGR01509 family)
VDRLREANARTLVPVWKSPSQGEQVIQSIIFDLSEVLIAGLVGVEEELSQVLPVPQEQILRCFGGDWLEELLVGDISEDAYLKHIITRERWQIGSARLKTAIRNNLHREVAGSLAILTELASRYELVLLSDHAREWIAYIKTIHPFVRKFKHTFFSYDLKRTKRDPEAFLTVLRVMSVPPHRCLFIDDNPDNVTVAESVGISGIRFVNAEQLAAELEGLRV